MLKKRSQNDLIIFISTTISDIGFKYPYRLHNIVDFNFISINGSRILILEFANNVNYLEIESQRFSGGLTLQKKKTAWPVTLSAQ
ncbi:hypothetical protein Xmau_02685 [Xenorhabdus mauleonii]|uniref:Uncharacterized protein n=1 Tax=Xenorhabdus mauleonii TaxID=351675 RepID=A0A1I3UM68_9GAMM|nr:hypothetical protein Xmau_02685 [Xenorhabdus mauleonii]SFJ82911.1 hypothetical protein SAMN05421680_11732 [Xenorhabdus mauleonii]